MRKNITEKPVTGGARISGPVSEAGQGKDLGEIDQQRPWI